MPRRKWNTYGVRLMGRKRTAPRQSWRKQEWITDEFHPHGVLADVIPMPGRTYTRYTWPCEVNHSRARAVALSFLDRHCRCCYTACMIDCAD